ncbi:hypothetical protein H6761_03450 [Candidatus Nomurabacteria bacterium]|nr:hypothetical protein [Candidatus Nomurabacteria bacterium]
MNKQEEKKSISEVIQAKLKEGKVEMHSKNYFILKNILIVSAVLFGLLLGTFLLSFVFFIAQANGSVFLPNFGFRGWTHLFVSLPWLIIFGAVVIIFFLEFFVKKHTTVYRQPILYSLFFIAAVVFLTSFFLRTNPVHLNFLDRSEDEDLPIISRMYRHYGMDADDKVYTGQISAIIDDRINLLLAQDRELEILVLKETRLPKKFVFKTGDWVMVMGEEEAGQIRAWGIHPLDEQWGPRFKPNFRPFMPSMPMMK